MASAPLQRRAATSTQTGICSVPTRRGETMRLSRRFAGPLAAGVMAAGATVAAAAPASASTVTPYWHIMTIPQGYYHPLCLQGDLGGPWARPSPSSPVTRTSPTRVSCGCRLPWVATSTSSRTSAPGGAWKPATAPSTAAPSTCGPASPPRATNAGTGHPPPPPGFPVPRTESHPDAGLRQQRVLPRRPGGADHSWASAPDLALQRHACPAILGRPVASRLSPRRASLPGSARGLDSPV